MFNVFQLNYKLQVFYYIQLFLNDIFQMLIKLIKIQYDLYRVECDFVKLISKENLYELYVMFENYSFLFYCVFLIGLFENWSCFFKWNCFFLVYGKKYCKFLKLKCFK